MKKIGFLLLIMLATFMSVTSVNAECVNLLDNLTHWTIDSSSGGYKGGRTTFRSKFTIDGTATDYILLENGKTYTLYVNDASQSFYDVLFNHDDVTSDYEFQLYVYYNNSSIILYPGDSKVSGLNTYYSLYDNSVTFTATNTNFQLSISAYYNDILTYKSYFKNATFWLVEGDSVCIETTDPETPVEPDDSETIIPDSTLDDFYSIYSSKLTLLSQYALQNKYLFGAIGIIIAFIVLELVLFLFNRGGYKR